MTDEATASAPATLAFAGDRPRVKTMNLDWPVSYAGKTYATISIKRLTAADVAAFIEKLGGGKFRFPIFVDDEGALVPDAVMDGLDDDDAMVLDKASLDFLPRRFREAPDKSKTESLLPTGDSTAPSSGA